MALLSAIGVHKSFAGVHALKGVSFELAAGEVHALVGENGAGKSTLIRILTGAERADAGSLVVAGDAVAMDETSPGAARARGIAAIYQQPALFPDLTVAENIAIGVERPHPWRPIDWRARRTTAMHCLERIGAELDPERLVRSLTMPEQQLLEIAKAVGAEARIVLMDEPTASLTDREVQRLFAVITTLRESGVGIIYISHRLEEVLTIADRITVLRDGLIVATGSPAAFTQSDLVRHIAGRGDSVPVVGSAMPVVGSGMPVVGSGFSRNKTADGGAVPVVGSGFSRNGAAESRAVPSSNVDPTTASADAMLQVRHLSSASHGVRDISFAVRRGEIVGIAGLVGSGRTELAETVFGLRRADAGTIEIGGTTVTITSPADAIRHGLAYVPEDRRRHGVVAPMSVTANTTLAVLPSVSRAGLIQNERERMVAARYVSDLRVKTSSLTTPVETLSGGNQQKLLLARWLATNPAVLILDEPTQGVDVAAKAEIHDLIRQQVGRGLAVLMISSELPEILAMSDRILVMVRGAIAGELSRADATAERVLALALGTRTPIDDLRGSA
jgi:rhamnose transport system ATP-binding protein